MPTSRCQTCGLQVAHVGDDERLSFEDYHHKTAHGPGSKDPELHACFAKGKHFGVCEVRAHWAPAFRPTAKKEAP